MTGITDDKLFTINLKAKRDILETTVSMLDFSIVTVSHQYDDNGGEGYSVDFTIKTYPITYNSNTTDEVTGMPENAIKGAGDSYTIKDGPTRDNYTFTGWNTEANGSGTSYLAGTIYTTDADLKLYAQWEAIKSKLTVNPNGGNWNGSTSQQVFEQAIGTTKKISNPTITPNGNIIKYNVGTGTLTSGNLQETQTTTFNGWTGAILSGTTYTFGENDETLTAQYKANAVTLPTVSAPVGHTFLGWYNGNTRVGGNGENYTPGYTTSGTIITLTAKYSENTYTLTINPNGGTYNGNTNNSTETGTYDSTKTLSTPTAPNGYTITLDNNDGTGTQNTVNQTKNFKNWTVVSGNGSINGATYKFGTTDGEVKAEYTANAVTLPTPTRTGYTFDGWYDKAIGGNQITSPYTPTADITLYAHWTALQSTLTVDPNGGIWNGTNTNSTISQDYGTTAIISNPTSTPNGNTITFNTNGGDTVNPITQTTIFDKWIKTGGGTWNEVTSTYTFDNSLATLTAQYIGQDIELPTATKAGANFLGWYDATTGGTKVGNAGDNYNPSKNVTLYAQWEEIKYNVTFKNDDGTVITTLQVPYGQNATYNGNTPEKSSVANGYKATFAGWNNASDLQNITKDVTVIATYNVVPIEYTITYYNTKESDNSLNPTTYTIEDTNITLQNLPNVGKYIFKGWYTSNEETAEQIKTINTSELINRVLYAHWENDDSLYLKSKKYKVGENNLDEYEDGDIYMNKITPKTTLSEFIDNCDTNGIIKIYKENGEKISNGSYVGTGMTIKVTKDDEEITMTAVVMGDIDGDGKNTATDLSELNKNCLGISTNKLQGARFLAADLDDNEKLTVTDLSELNKAILEIITLKYVKPNK